MACASVRKREQRKALAQALTLIPCRWCGDKDAGFYHPECARRMVDENQDQYRQLLLTSQKSLRALYRALVTPTGHLDQASQQSTALAAVATLQRITRRCLTTHKDRP